MPAAIAVAMPVVALIDAMVASLLVQEPPLVVFVRVVVEPTQALAVPVIEAGNSFTVTAFVAVVPVLSV